MDGGKIHTPAGGTKAPRPTTLIEVNDNKLSMTKVDGEIKSNPQPA